MFVLINIAVLILTVWKICSPEIVTIGNNQSSSTATLGEYTHSVSFLLVDYELVNGTLRQILFTQGEKIALLRIQVWRPITEVRFRLVHEWTYQAQISSNVSFYPGDNIRVQDGDRFGFTSEAYDSGIVYIFDPQRPGATVRVRYGTEVARINHTYSFEEFGYDTWVFSLAFVVDTEFGLGPIGATLPMPTVETSTYNYETSAAPITVLTIGNDIINGTLVEDSAGTILLVDHPLPEGFLINFHFFSGLANQTIWLQVWRCNQTSVEQCLLADQRNISIIDAGNQTIAVDPPMGTEEGDFIGITSESNMPITAQIIDNPPSNTSFLPLYGDGMNGSLPEVGSIYNFTGSYPNYGFSIAVDVDTDIYKYVTRPPRIPVARQDRYSSDELALLLIIILLYILIACICTIYAIWIIKRRTRKVELVSDEKPILTSITPSADWMIPRANIYLYEMLCECSMGVVMKAEVFGIASKAGWTTASVRMLRGRHQGVASDQEKHVFLREMEVMRSLKPHPNVLQLMGCCIEKDPAMMITEPVPFGSLLDHLRDLKETNIHMNIAGHSNFTLTMDLIGFGAQVARGMAHLASLRILHRDLAARNILLGEGRLCKLTYFGHAQDVVESRQYDKVTKNALPIRWMAPESYHSNIFTSKSDVWSFGVVLWEISTLGATPYQDMQANRIFKALKRGYRMDPPPHCREELYDVLTSCWKYKPHDRPNFDELSHTLQDLHDENRDLIQLEKYPEDHYVFMTSLGGEEVV